MKKFLVGVAKVTALTKAGEHAFTSNTMLDNSIEVSISNEDITGGPGNGLQFIYFHTPDMTINLTETQFNLDMIASNFGSEKVTGGNVWEEESVTLGVGGTGSVTKGTPILPPDTTATTPYGWVANADGDRVKVEFTNSSFTVASASEGDKVCVRYYTENSAAKIVTIPANFTPGQLRLIMECQLASSNTGKVSDTNIIGRVEFEIETAQLTGAQTISMSSTGVAQTPLVARALAGDTSSGCSSTGLYGSIKEILKDAVWYDDVNALAIADNTLTMDTADTEKLSVYGVRNTGATMVRDYEDLTFATSDAGVATVDTDGIVTAVASGSAVISVTVTDKSSIGDVQATVTVS